MGEFKMNFELSSNQLKYRDILNKEFLELEIWAISDINPNRNQTHFTLESMQKSLDGFKNKPIVGFFNKGDFEQHNFRLEYDPEIEKAYRNTDNGERVLGCIRESDPVEIVEKDGLHWIKVRCALWVQYCYKQVRRLLKDRNKKVSVEITVNKCENINGVEEIYDFTLNGITILGSKNGKPIIEAIPDAHLTILEKLDESVLENQKKVLSFAYKQMDNSVGAEYNKNNGKEGNPQMEEQLKDMAADNGNSPDIKVDKSKEAMSDKDWGSVDKTALRNKVVSAGNFKEVAKDVFLDLREGWEDGEVSKLKYPVMEINDNTAVYNRGALGSAKAYAEKNNEEKVLSKLKEIYENLDLGEDEEGKYSCDFCDEIYGCDCGDGDNGSQNSGEGDDDNHSGENSVNSDLNKDIEDKMKDKLDLSSNPEGEGTVVSNPEPEVVTDGGENNNAVTTPAGNEPADPNATMPQDDNIKDLLKDARDPKDEEIEKLNAKVAELQTLCDGYSEEIANLKKDAEEKQQQFADYDNIKSRMEIAEKKVWEHYCDGLKTMGEKLMSKDNIKDSDKEAIMNKCSAGEYSCEEDLKKDIAYAIYKARPEDNGSMYSVQLPLTNETENNKNTMSREERIAARAGKNK